MQNARGEELQQKSSLGISTRPRRDSDVEGTGGISTRRDSDVEGTGGISTRRDSDVEGTGGISTRRDSDVEGTGGISTRRDSDVEGMGGISTRRDSGVWGTGGISTCRDSGVWGTGGISTCRDSGVWGTGGISTHRDSGVWGTGGISTRRDSGVGGTPGISTRRDLGVGISTHLDSGVWGTGGISTRRDSGVEGTGSISTRRDSGVGEAGSIKTRRDSGVGEAGSISSRRDSGVGGTGGISSTAISHSVSRNDPQLPVTNASSTSHYLHAFCGLLRSQARSSRHKSSLRTCQLRSKWMGRVDCSISLIAAAVGLGNLTHFPYLAHMHGAGTFLFPFILVTGLVAVPLFYLEACLGQLSGQGAVLGWGMVPLFKGVGLSIGMTSALLSIYYSVMCIYPLFYFGSSFINPLPWSHCKNPWNTKDCIHVTVCDQDSEQRLDNGTCYSSREAGPTGVWNLTASKVVTGRVHSFSSLEYWMEKVEGRGEVGPIQGHLVVCLFAVWLVCFLALISDIQQLGKIMIFCVLIMFMVLIVLVFNGALLPHEIDGVNYFLTPKFEAWGNSEVWFDASGETFFGAVLGTGIIATMTSYSRYSDGNPLRMSVTVVVGDSLTSVIWGFVFFTRAGYLAYQLKVPVFEIAKYRGSKLAYIIYPESILGSDMGAFLSVMFFLALGGLGITSQIAFSHVLTTTILDMFPPLMRKRHYTLLVFCLLGFLMALPFTLKGGNHWVAVLASHVGPFCLLVNGLMEVIVTAWAYGVDNLFEDLELMLGEAPSLYFKICWKFIIPLYLMVLLLWTLISQHMDSTAVVVGRVVAFIPVLAFLCSVIYTVLQVVDLPLRKRVRTLMVPYRGWTLHPVQSPRLGRRSTTSFGLGSSSERHVAEWEMETGAGQRNRDVRGPVPTRVRLTGHRLGSLKGKYHWSGRRMRLGSRDFTPGH